jgi:hypothetical protein
MAISIKVELENPLPAMTRSHGIIHTGFLEDQEKDVGNAAQKYYLRKK